jgi:hypothetical protein
VAVALLAAVEIMLDRALLAAAAVDLLAQVRTVELRPVVQVKVQRELVALLAAAVEPVAVQVTQLQQLQQ